MYRKKRMRRTPEDRKSVMPLTSPRYWRIGRFGGEMTGTLDSVTGEGLTAGL
jgi:hypothetical protein